MRDPFHQVAIAAEHVRVVIDDVVGIAVIDRSLVSFRSRHSNRHRKALPKRPGRHLYTRSLTVLRVTRSVRTPLPELLQLRDRQVVSRKMQRAIQQRRRVPIREHEPVPVDPLRIRRIVLHQLVVEQISDRSASKRSAGMARLRLLHGIDSEKAECVDGDLVNFVLFRILLFAHSFPLLFQETRRVWRR